MLSSHREQLVTALLGFTQNFKFHHVNSGASSLREIFEEAPDEEVLCWTYASNGAFTRTDRWEDVINGEERRVVAHQTIYVMDFGYVWSREVSFYTEDGVLYPHSCNQRINVESPRIKRFHINVQPPAAYPIYDEWLPNDISDDRLALAAKALGYALWNDVLTTTAASFDCPELLRWAHETLRRAATERLTNPGFFDVMCYEHLELTDGPAVRAFTALVGAPRVNPDSIFDLPSEFDWLKDFYTLGLIPAQYSHGQFAVQLTPRRDFEQWSWPRMKHLLRRHREGHFLFQ